ncbi:hypothetical protein ABKV19_010402 [Rosa sericea]
MKSLTNKYLCTVNSMKPIIGPLYLSLFLHIISQLVASDSQRIYTPVEDITIACGDSSTQISKFDNRTWSGDINSEIFPFEQDQVGNNTSQVRKAPSSSFTGRVPYTTARVSHSKFTYRFSLTTGQKFIRLYFYHASYADFDRSKALFSVKAGGYTLFQDFNASATVDATGVETIYREFCLNIYDGDQSLNITFTPSKAKQAYAFINGIEIVSMPTYLYYTAPQSNGVNYIGGGVSFPIEENIAMEMVYRINIGGSSVSSNQDTGMYRNWDGEDETYLDESIRNLTVSPSNPSIQLKFARIPEYSAPKEVYQTGRLIDKNKTNNQSYNLTWEFPVDSNHGYLLRLHFCELEPEIRERTFLTYIGNQAADTVDIVEWGGGNGIPVYRDYMVVLSNPERQKKASLFITLQAFQLDWMIQYNNAILNGLEILKLIGSKGPQAGSSANPKVTPLSPRTSKSSSPVLAIAAGVVSSIVVFSALGFLIFRQRWKDKESGSNHRTMKLTMTPSSSPSYLCRYFSLAEIKAATKNFNHNFVIGVGGFGNVYKGCIDGGANVVAIKRLKPESSQGADEFKTEIELLSQLRHRHLVSLIGYCTDKGEMILVYDYMARGSLRDHLYHTNNSTLSWEQRLQICIGTAQGLQYLHGGAKGTIIHRDVKSTNILLDEKWVAKVSDFGLSKMGSPNMSKTHISTVVKGSFGYLDPEYYRRQRLTEKSDVYSFGVVLFEVLCAKPAVINTEEMRQMNLSEWAKSCHHKGELDRIIDPSLTGNIATESLNKFVDIAMSCVHENGVERPSMDDVLRGLEFALQIHHSQESDINSIERKVETETSSGEPSCATKDSITCISGTIFSEINNPSGR